MEFGPVQVFPLVIAAALLGMDAAWTRDRQQQIMTRLGESERAHSAGVVVGLWSAWAVIVIVGLLALFGYIFAFVLFAVGTLWRAIGPTKTTAAGFRAGYKQATGKDAASLASVFWILWFGVTRGVPLVLLYILLFVA